MLVRERPRLDLDIDIETPGGRHVHWSEQEPDPANVPSGYRHSSTMPGGHESLEVVLPRKRGISYADVERLSTVTAYGPGGDNAWQGRLERAPRSSGDRMSVSPGCVGWQAALEDNQAARMIYVDRDLGRWQPPSREARLTFWGSGFTAHDPSQQPDPVSGLPALRLGWVGPWVAAALPGSQATYDAGAGLTIAALYYDYVTKNLTAANMHCSFRCGANDHGGGVDSGDLLLSGLTLAGYFTPATPGRFMYAWMQDDTSVAGGANDTEYMWTIRTPAVYGNHGLTRRGTDPGGFYPSDIVAHAIGEWCPLLNYTTGAGGTIRPDTFIIPHLAFHENTTAAEIIRQATRFGLQDWAVWDNRTFYWHPRGEFGRSWRARASQSQLEETGQSVERLWNGVINEYRDVDGSTKTVGPTGSGSDTESTDLEDADPENPANQLGIRKWTKLQMGTSTAAGATEVGRRFLEETKALDSSGRARFVGHVTDDRGVVHPAWRVRAGDTVSFVDSSDVSPRRVVAAQYEHASRSCSVDLDAPPDGMTALLERLNVVLVPLLGL